MAIYMKDASLTQTVQHWVSHTLRRMNNFVVGDWTFESLFRLFMPAVPASGVDLTL